ncbi:hypothetical protein ACH3O9_00905 [Leeuwenhoekiella sp. A16]|uniref:hypothetical protein n=1 Tax=Leeuwenhoekiella sp. A16 TaxID=3141462 RepID=UPI003A801C47
MNKIKYLYIFIPVICGSFLRQVDKLDGFYYSIVFNSSEDEHYAQFSTIFYSSCNETTVTSKLSEYRKKTSFLEQRVEGPFTSGNEADSARIDAKQQWKDSGYKIGGDNNFFGDCSE